MLPKKNRADRKSIQEIFKKGRFLSSPGLNFRFIAGTGGKKVSFIVPKSISKSAVKRNQLRRRGYAALKRPLEEFSRGITGALTLKSPKLSLEDLEKEVKFILNKLK